MKTIFILCDTFIDKFCVGNNNDKIFYIDSHHLSNVGANHILKNSLFKILK